jgi:hypothetical protein
MKTRTIISIIVGILTLGLTAPALARDAGAGYDPELRPKDFVAKIDNPYLPLTEGSRWVYEQQTDEGLERIVVEVTDEEKRVLGIDATVVHDTVFLDGVIIEDTWDWYAQDVDGNVWYLGEDTHEYEDGIPVNSAGAWQAGVDGAKPGIVMHADPKIGKVYRQEYYAGEAEDMGKVLSLTESVTVPFGTFDDVLQTKDFTPLDPGVVEHKFYAKGIGVVLELGVKGGSGRTELIEHSKG